MLVPFSFSRYMFHPSDEDCHEGTFRQLMWSHCSLGVGNFIDWDPVPLAVWQTFITEWEELGSLDREIIKNAIPHCLWRKPEKVKGELRTHVKTHQRIRAYIFSTVIFPVSLQLNN